jgi:hypothetical protein
VKARLGAALIQRDLLNEKIALLETVLLDAGASHDPRHFAG